MSLLTDSPLQPSLHNMADQDVSRDPTDVLAEAELQWIYTEEELQRTPSIVDGMKAEEERQLRSKGTNFITQVGIMLKLPQTTLCTASVFFNRFLMRRSLVKKDGHKPLHHYVGNRRISLLQRMETLSLESSANPANSRPDTPAPFKIFGEEANEVQQIAATALFLATKVEEHTRKLKDLVAACCRVAQKNPNLLVDEQTKDFWLWRDTIIYNEDVLLETLCFDLTTESPYKLLYDFLRYFGLHHNKKLRDGAWAFLNDSNMTQLCLLYTSRVIAATGLYYAAKATEVELPEDQHGRPWWEVQKLKLRDVKKAMNYMVDFYENSPLIAGQANSQYAGFRTPIEDLDDPADAQSSIPRSPFPELTNNGEQSSVKREREEEENGGASSARTNGHSRAPISRVPPQVRSSEPDAKKPKAENGELKPKDEGSEEGEVEE